MNINCQKHLLVSNFAIKLKLIDWGYNLFDIQEALSRKKGEKILKELTKILFSTRERAHCSAAGRR